MDRNTNVFWIFTIGIILLFSSHRFASASVVVSNVQNSVPEKQDVHNPEKLTHEKESSVTGSHPLLDSSSISKVESENPKNVTGIPEGKQWWNLPSLPSLPPLPALPGLPSIFSRPPSTIPNIVPAPATPQLIFVYPPAKPQTPPPTPPPPTPAPTPAPTPPPPTPAPTQPPVSEPPPTPTPAPPKTRHIQFSNRCGFDIWINPLTSKQGAPLQEGLQRLVNRANFTYNIPTGGWEGRFWPKYQCNPQGQNCTVGQSVDPCPATGCEPPAETKVEFFYPPLDDRTREIYYDISLVDGYTLPVSVVPSVQQGSCTATQCVLSLSRCPTNENGVGDLRVISQGRIVQCLSPCKRWNFGAPFGLGRPETQEPGLHLCCPTPPISSEQCRAGPIISTQYVQLIHRDCPTAYSYAYDDVNGLHNCPNNVETSFDVTFCPTVR